MLVSRTLPCEVIVNELPAVLAVTLIEEPRVPDIVCLVRNILEFAVTSFVFTTAVPAASVAIPILALVPSAISNPAPTDNILTEPLSLTRIFVVSDAPISTELSVELAMPEPKAVELYPEAVLLNPNAEAFVFEA